MLSKYVKPFEVQTISNSLSYKVLHHYLIRLIQLTHYFERITEWLPEALGL